MTKHIIFVRRRKLGHGSTLGLQHELREAGYECDIWRNDRDIIPIMERNTLDKVFIRWGCTSSIPRVEGSKVIQYAEGMHTINNKLGFLEKLRTSDLGEADGVLTMMKNPESVLRYFQDETTPLVIRPPRHAQGRNLEVVSSFEEFRSVLTQRPFSGGFYARPLVNKAAEYRVYVVKGKVAVVARKIPEDPSAVAWNHAQGSTFVNCRWDDWPLDVCQLACNIFKQTGCDFSGIDIMVDTEGKPWFIEANAAPSLPRNEDNSPSYRQRCMAKAFAHTIENNLETLDDNTSYTGWRHYIHPAIWSRST